MKIINPQDAINELNDISTLLDKFLQKDYLLVKNYEIKKHCESVVNATSELINDIENGLDIEGVEEPVEEPVEITEGDEVVGYYHPSEDITEYNN